MRWDLRKPWRPFMDRFVLSAGHTVPLVYATLAVLNEVLRARQHATTRRVRLPGRRAVGADLGGPARSCGAAAGCPATPRWRARPSSSSSTPGPPGHGMPPAAGEALALKLAGARRSRSSWSRARAASRRAPATRRATPPGASALEPRLPGRLERLRDRRRGHPRGRARHAGELVRRLRLARDRHRAGLRVGAR